MEPLNVNIFAGQKGRAEDSKKIIICEKHLEGTDCKYYNDAAKYWGDVDPSVDGMLGGFGNISAIDIEGSAKFLKGIFKVK